MYVPEFWSQSFWSYWNSKGVPEILDEIILRGVQSSYVTLGREDVFCKSWNTKHTQSAHIVLTFDGGAVCEDVCRWQPTNKAVDETFVIHFDCGSSTFCFCCASNDSGHPMEWGHFLVFQFTSIECQTAWTYKRICGDTLSRDGSTKWTVQCTDAVTRAFRSINSAVSTNRTTTIDHPDYIISSLFISSSFYNAFRLSVRQTKRHSFSIAYITADLNFTAKHVS